MTAPGRQLSGIRPAGAPYQLLERQDCFAGKLIRVHRDRLRLPNGLETVHESISYPGAVAIIPLLEDNPLEPVLILLEQFRSSVGGFIHEVPAGMLMPDEDPLACARRELEEETGYAAGRWEHVATLLPTPGISAVRMVYFLARDLEFKNSQNLEAAECLTVKKFPLKRLVEALVFGVSRPEIPAIVDAKTHMAVFYLGARWRSPPP